MLRRAAPRTGARAVKGRPSMSALPRPLGRALRVAALVVATAVGIGGCASVEPPPPTALLRDALFAPPKRVADASDLFKLSDEMRRYIDARSTPGSTRDARRTLIDALYRDSELRLRYDPEATRTAAEAFDGRAGNCLSLVVMTAAFAKHLGLPHSYRRVLVDDTYRRSGGLELASGHVNLALAPPSALEHAGPLQEMVVDFLPAVELRGQRAVPLDEKTLVAMYLNNRAAEALAAGDVDQAYAWARAAVLQQPGFVAGVNTLGVVYERAGHVDAAEAALRHALTQQPDDVAALTNLVALLQRTGRADDARGYADRLARVQPFAPFAEYDRGRAAMSRGDPAAARDHFLRELRLQPDQEDVHFWTAQAYWALGDAARTARHLRAAQSFTTAAGGAARYAAKLERLRSTTSVH